MNKELTIRFTSRINVTFADYRGTKRIAAGYNTVYIYTENGQLQRKVDHCGLKYRKEMDYLFSGKKSFDEVISGQTHKLSRRRLLSFSETGELINSFILGMNMLS